MYKITDFFCKKIQFPDVAFSIYYDLFHVMNIETGCDYISSQFHLGRDLHRVLGATTSPDFLGMGGKGNGKTMAPGTMVLGTMVAGVRRAPIFAHTSSNRLPLSALVAI